MNSTQPPALPDETAAPPAAVYEAVAALLCEINPQTWLPDASPSGLAYHIVEAAYPVIAAAVRAQERVEERRRTLEWVLSKAIDEANVPDESYFEAHGSESATECTVRFIKALLADPAAAPVAAPTGATAGWWGGLDALVEAAAAERAAWAGYSWPEMSEADRKRYRTACRPTTEFVAARLLGGASTAAPTEPACSTCDDVGANRLDGQHGVPGSGGWWSCPDCRPMPSVPVDEPAEPIVRVTEAHLLRDCANPPSCWAAPSGEAHRKFGYVDSYRDRGLCGYPLGGSNPGVCIERPGHDFPPGRTDHRSDGSGVAGEAHR